MFGSFSTAVATLLLGAVYASPCSATPAPVTDPRLRFANMTLELPPQTFPALHTSFNHAPDCGEQSYKGSGRLRGMKALITGGDSGIGRAIVIAYLREGAQVAINYLPEEEADAEDLADFLAAEGLAFERIPGDLGNETFCTELVQEAHSRMGGLDILVNHAGFAGNLRGPNWRPIESFSTEEYLQLLRINLLAPLFLVRAAVPLLPPGGSIIATSSGVVANPVDTSVLYGSSKAALTHTVRSLALQLMDHGIRVNGVAPGLTYAPFLVSGGFTTEMITLGSQMIPIGRLSQPVESAPYYVYAADPTNTYLTGEILAAIGGDTGF